MRNRLSIFLIILTLFTLTMAPNVIDNKGTTVKAAYTNDDIYNMTEDIYDALIALQDWLDDFEDDLNDSLGYNGKNSSIFIDLKNLTGQVDNLSNQVNNLDYATLENLTIRLDIIDDIISNINDRLGYPMSDPDATIYDDLSYILDGLTYENDGTRFWLLKNVSGVPHLQILGQNQQLIADYQISMNSTFIDGLDGAVGDINSNTEIQADSIKDGQGGTYTLVLILLIIVLFFIAWKLYLKERFFPSNNSGFNKPSNEGFGKPSCFGDPNECNPDYNPNCASCRWLQKCQAACIRNDMNEENPSARGIDVERDGQGNIIALYDEGERINLPSCFGKEYDPQTNRDCQECAINDYCAEQLNKNMQNMQQRPVSIPPMQKQYKQQPPSRRITPARGAVGPSFGEDILQDF